MWITACVELLTLVSLAAIPLGATSVPRYGTVEDHRDFWVR